MFILARIALRVFGWMSVEVADEELIVRAIFSPYHVDSKNKLKLEAFHPTPQTDEISVMRSSILGPRTCKRMAKKLETPTKTLRGFAVLSVRTTRSESFQVIDSRHGNFLGHADIRTGLTAPAKGVARSADELLRLRDHCRRLVTIARYYADPFPTKLQWKGQKLRPLG